MNEMPVAFRQRISSHNRHCWVAAALSLLGASLLWMLYGAIFTAAVLTFETVRTGDSGVLTPPEWFVPAGGGIVAFLFAWALLDRWAHRHTPTTDRSVIGLHLLREVALMPARMTLAVWDYLTSQVRLSHREQEQAWHLLETIAEMQRAPRSGLTYHVPEPDKLSKLLLALQLTDWIDLHKGDEDWFYTVRGDQIDSLRKILLPEI